MFASTGRMTYQDSANCHEPGVHVLAQHFLATLLPVTALLVVGRGPPGAEPSRTSHWTAGGHPLGYLLVSSSLLPILSMVKEREPRYPNIREKVLRDAKRAPVPAPAAVGAVAGARATAATCPRRAGVGTNNHHAPAFPPARPSSKSRAGSKKAKRRKKC